MFALVTAVGGKTCPDLGRSEGGRGLGENVGVGVRSPIFILNLGKFWGVDL